MPTKQKPQKRPEGDLLYYRRVLGCYLRDARVKAGLSLRQLENRCGVNNSEIYKIEAGSQECRLESFIRICASLGLPAGVLLDEVVSSDFGFYQDRMASAPLMVKLTERFPELRDYVAASFAVVAAWSAHLLRSARPVLKAGGVAYPADSMRTAFVRFAEQVEKLNDSEGRRALLDALAADPLAELFRLKLLNVELMQDYIKALVSAKASDVHMGKNLAAVSGLKVAVPFWSPFLPSVDKTG